MDKQDGRVLCIHEEECVGGGVWLPGKALALQSQPLGKKNAWHLLSRLCGEASQMPKLTHCLIPSVLSQVQSTGVCGGTAEVGGDCTEGGEYQGASALWDQVSFQSGRNSYRS